MIVVEELLIDNLKIYQDDELYRFTSDAVILSKFASAKKGDVVADFCAGSGIVGVHYYALNKNAKSVDLIEIQPELSALSQKTVDVNGLGEIFTVINKPIQDLPNDLNGKYSLILCNPPYKKAGSGEVNGDRKIAMCRHEITVTQEEIIEISAKKLKHGGRLCMCQRTERFTDMVLKMASVGLSPTKVQFVVTKQGGAPYLFLIEAVKGVKPQLKILPEFVNEGV
ncbi:MAG: methyltransferase [Clostridia bacterium]|nr:methyltransferase [Clostridia bacterium]